MRAARRLNVVPEYFFAALDTRISRLREQGISVIRLDIGSPDAPPAGHIVDALAQSAANPLHHGYPGYTGSRELRRAIADYYARRFRVELDLSCEVLPLLGSKEGIANIATAWLDPGDLALAPDPGYPTYRSGILLAGAEIYPMPLLEENGFLPELTAIPEEVARRARLMWLNYPNNPTGATAAPSFFEEAVHFCRRHDILLCHDAPYADVCYDGHKPESLLSVPGAKDVAIEFNSLSKSHNMAGWRIGFVVGNRTAIAALLRLKTNLDSGIFVAIQDAAVAALSGDQTWLEGRNAEYARRRNALHGVLTRDLGLAAAMPQAGLYLWPRVPEGWTSAKFAERVLMETGISLTAGANFGAHGEGFVRISLGQHTPLVLEAADRLRQFRI